MTLILALKHCKIYSFIYLLMHSFFMQIICHIGFPKTGTTFLQKNVFPNISDVNYIDRTAIKDLSYALIEKDDSYYDAEKIKADVAKMHDSNSIMLISDEALTGHHIKTEFPNRSQIARRLKAAGVSKIIISIRNQVDVLESTYKQYIKSGGVLKVSKFFDLGDNRSPYFYINYFNYEKIIELYAEIFGRENILVVQFENIFENKTEFTNRLNGFLQLENIDLKDALHLPAVNDSLSNFSTKSLRAINHFTYNVYRPSSLIHRRLSTNLFYRILKRVDVFSKKRNKLIAKYEDEIRAHFAASNGALVQNYNIELHEKYPI